MRLPERFRPRRYGPGARFYDVLSLERPLYRAGRVAAVAQLGPLPGRTVLDVGCGTGLNLPLLVEGVGPAGRVLGVDASADMLAVARRRVADGRWTNVRLVHGDAARVGDLLEGEHVDAAIFAYSLGVIGDWRAAWSGALRLVRPGGRVVVVDTDRPHGLARLLRPLSAAFLGFGGVHPRRRVWELVPRVSRDSSTMSLRSGHVQVAAGTLR